MRRILDALNQMSGTKAIKIHGGVFGEAGTPDIVCAHRGRVFLFEVKTKTGRVSEIQLYRLKQWQDAGATTAVVRSVAEVVEMVTGGADGN